MKIFVDANVAIYAAGRDHPLKEPSKEVLRTVAGRPRSFLTDAEVLQELLHRYLSLRMWPEGKRAVTRFADVMRDRVEVVRAEDVELAADLADDHFPHLSARDLLHAAVMLRVGARDITTADRNFDRLSEAGIRRLDPANVQDWRALLDRPSP